MLKPLNREQLDNWEKEMDRANLHCYVPERLLESLFDKSVLSQILGENLKNKDNISYLTQKHPISVRYLNDAFVWSQVLKKIEFKGDTVAELGPGTSKVIDLALSMYNFGGTLFKIDYTQWVEKGSNILKRSFKTESLAIDIVQNTQEIPAVDLLLMNHFWEDLYIGLWSKDSGIDYFGFAINKIEENHKCWEKSMVLKDKYNPQVVSVVNELSRRIKPSGFAIIKSYPSGFETNYKQVERINFTFELTNLVAKNFEDAGLKSVPIDLESVDGPAASKYPNSFFVLHKIF